MRLYSVTMLIWTTVTVQNSTYHNNNSWWCIQLLLRFSVLTYHHRVAAYKSQRGCNMVVMTRANWAASWQISVFCCLEMSIWRKGHGCLCGEYPLETSVFCNAKVTENQKSQSMVFGYVFDCLLSTKVPCTLYAQLFSPWMGISFFKVKAEECCKNWCHAWFLLSLSGTSQSTIEWI